MKLDGWRHHLVDCHINAAGFYRTPHYHVILCVEYYQDVPWKISILHFIKKDITVEENYSRGVYILMIDVFNFLFC